MKKVLSTYGNELYNKSLDLLEKTAYKIGKVDKVYTYTRKWLETTDFYKKSKLNQYILNKPRGNGFFMWKPFIILETFKSLEDNDVVLYSDAGVKVIGNLNPLFEVAKSNPNGGKMLFKLPTVGVPHHLAKTWTKRDCFVLMNCDSEKYWNANMTNGAISLWRKTSENIKFLEEWQKYLKDPRIVTDDGNMMGKPNFMEFRDHRHDQSVLTLLSIKYNFELFRDPTQYGNEEISKFNNSTYGQLFHHHRNFKH